MTEKEKILSEALIEIWNTWQDHDEPDDEYSDGYEDALSLVAGIADKALQRTGN